MTPIGARDLTSNYKYQIYSTEGFLRDGPGRSRDALMHKDTCDEERVWLLSVRVRCR